ncbi:hypothetical protein BKA56DRAFT_619071 [Ilyonectria sp. MPI-CAGE-AT-0026]|nr:hypothetical protein BKA56DRAFT_619071 [Ilyonectria sp. MPI-CAGE-AT-0026]
MSVSSTAVAQGSVTRCQALGPGSLAGSQDEFLSLTSARQNSNATDKPVTPYRTMLIPRLTHDPDEPVNARMQNSFYVFGTPLATRDPEVWRIITTTTTIPTITPKTSKTPT